jgi:hypothetical protein
LIWLQRWIFVGVGSGGAQGWYQDPFGLHEARYFSAGRPTRLVRDSGIESYDDPPGTGAPADVGASSPQSGTEAAVIALNINVSYLPTENVRQIFVGGSLYQTASSDGFNTVAEATGGPMWVRMPPARSQSADIDGRDPLLALAAFSQPDADVRTLGVKPVDGTVCTGYTLTVSEQAWNRAVTAAGKELGVQVPTLTAQISPPTYSAWFDAQGLVRELVSSVQIAGGAATDTLTMRFGGFGSAVSIARPARSEVVAYGSWLHHSGDVDPAGP